jgi:hypothetical protein
MVAPLAWVNSWRKESAEARTIITLATSVFLSTRETVYGWVKLLLAVLLFLRVNCRGETGWTAASKRVARRMTSAGGPRINNDRILVRFTEGSLLYEDILIDVGGKVVALSSTVALLAL